MDSKSCQCLVLRHRFRQVNSRVLFLQRQLPQVRLDLDTGLRVCAFANIFQRLLVQHSPVVKRRSEAYGTDIVDRRRGRDSREGRASFVQPAVRRDNHRRGHD